MSLLQYLAGRRERQSVIRLVCGCAAACKGITEGQVDEIVFLLPQESGLWHKTSLAISLTAP